MKIKFLVYFHNGTDLVFYTNYNFTYNFEFTVNGRKNLLQRVI